MRPVTCRQHIAPFKCWLLPHGLAGALFLAPVGAYIQYFEEATGGTRSFTVLASVDAVMLMITTAIAFLFAVRGRITAHRHWMTRSYAVALVFFEGRLISGLTSWEASDTTTQTVIWTCLALSFLLAEIANQWLDIQSAMSVGVARAAALSTPEMV